MVTHTTTIETDATAEIGETDVMEFLKGCTKAETQEIFTKIKEYQKWEQLGSLYETLVKEVDEDIETKNICPRCGYKF